MCVCDRLAVPHGRECECSQGRTHHPQACCRIFVYFELDMYVAEQTFEACGEGTRTGREIPLVLIDGIRRMIRRARVYLCVEVCAVSESDEVARKSVL